MFNFLLKKNIVKSVLVEPFTDKRVENKIASQSP